MLLDYWYYGQRQTLSEDHFNYEFYFFSHGPGNSVGIVTDYRLDGPGIESRWGEIFRPSRPALTPTQLPVQWIPRLSRG